MVDFSIRPNPEDIVCPNCSALQRVNIYEATEPWDSEGEFKMECDDCDEDFIVKYHYIPCVNTSKSIW